MAARTLRRCGAFLLLSVAVGALLLAGCGGGGGPSPSSTATQTETGAATTTPPQTRPTAPEGAQRAADAARQDLVGRIPISVYEIEVISVERRQWPNACLGVPQPGEVCAEVITPGYEVVLGVPSGTKYVYHTDESSTTVRLAGTTPEG